MKNIFNKSLIRNFCQNSDRNIIRHTDVCIVGGGSVGLALSSLLTKYQVDHVILEKEAKIADHPKAHYLSPRTIEILNYSDTFKSNEGKSFLENNIKNINNWRHYRYCSYLLDANSYLGEIDHFHPDAEAKLKYINILSNAYPMHIGQNKLNKILFNNLKGKVDEYVINSRNFEKFEYNQNEKLYEIHTSEFGTNTSSNLTIKSKILVGCDGSHSKLRKLLNITNTGVKSIQSFVNAHFFSQDLAKKLKEINKQSMLHFIFNPQLVCVLICYDIDKGEFVMQIPYSTEIEKENCFDEKECRKIISMLLSNDELSRQIKFWKMKNVIVNKWYQERIFIIGDAAHQYPPSGGYGLNSGITDAFSLAWLLKYILDKKDADNIDEATMLMNEEILKNNFEKERIIHSTFVSKCAKMNYDKFLGSCRALGLNIQHMNLLESVIKNVVPSSMQRSIFNKLLNTGIYLNHVINSENLRNHLTDRKNHIQLIFPYLDYDFNFKNSGENEIRKYESMTEINPELSVGMIIPNYRLLNQEIRLRQLLKDTQDKSEFPLFFIITKKEKISEIKRVKLFDEKINLDFFKYEIFYITEKDNNIHCDESAECDHTLDVEEIKKYDMVVIRPDFVIEYISKR